MAQINAADDVAITFGKYPITSLLRTENASNTANGLKKSQHFRPTDSQHGALHDFISANFTLHFTLVDPSAFGHGSIILHARVAARGPLFRRRADAMEEDLRHNG